jgi:hypothetical protein
MKKLMLSAALTCTLLTGFSQDSTRNKFSFAIRTGIGAWLEDLNFTTGQIGVQAEYRISPALSVFLPIQYNHLFYLYGFENATGYIGLMAGPRAYIANKFFVGIGLGYSFFLEDDVENGSFMYYPHAGMDFRKTQLSLGYTNFGDADGSPGFLDITVAFKIGGKKK